MARMAMTGLHAYAKGFVAGFVAGTVLQRALCLTVFSSLLAISISMTD